MRISDWSSDVCSSDLILLAARPAVHGDHPDAAVLGDARDGRGVAVLAVPAGAHLHGDRQVDRLHHRGHDLPGRSEEHTSELKSLMRTSYAVFCLKKKK